MYIHRFYIYIRRMYCVCCSDYWVGS